MTPAERKRARKEKKKLARLAREAGEREELVTRPKPTTQAGVQAMAFDIPETPERDVEELL
jgi:hypothetical protein